MSMNLSEIAQKLGCRLDGPGETPIHGIAGIEHAEPGHITFLANRRYFPLLKTTRASAVLVEEGIKHRTRRQLAPPCGAAYLKSLPRFCPRHRTLLPSSQLRAGISPYGAHREIRENRRRRAYRSVLRGRRGCPNRAKRRSAQLRHHLSGRSHWR